MSDKFTITYDLAVLGGGPGGYPAAITAVQNGLKVVLIEKDSLGGTCLNRGCIPSKALIANADVLQKIQEASDFGIVTKGITFDFAKMASRKDQVVTKMRNGLTSLIDANLITVVKGFGKFNSPHEIKVTGQDNGIIHAKQVIIATGSEPRNMPAFPFDNLKVHSSTSILELTKLPESLVIIGGGVIGCEFASLYNALGVKITIIELMSTILPTECKCISSAIASSFEKRGIKIHTATSVDGIDVDKKGIKIRIAKGDTFEAEMALVSVGRTLNTSQIGLEKAGVLVKDNGLIPVNDKMETNVPGIYAVGDISSSFWLAHVASHQGIVAANNVSEKEAFMHYNAIPAVIFTHPEVGTVGMTLEQALVKGYKAVLGAFPFMALGKSQASLQTEGFAQIVTDSSTGQILGAQVVGHEAATLIAEMAIAIANELTIECITETIHAHPTISEAWLEAAFIAQGIPLHIPPKKKKKVSPLLEEAAINQTR